MVMQLSSLIIGAAIHVAAAASSREPVIDMHMHAWSLAEFGTEPPEACVGRDGIDMHGIDPGKPFDFKAQASCRHMLKAPETDAALLAQTLSMMDRYDIVAGVISGDGTIVAKWSAAAPGRFITGANFFIDDNRPPASHAAELEAAVKRGET